MSLRTITDPLMNIREMRKQQLLPRNEDFKGLAASLVRLQDTYSLDLHELTKGNMHTEIPRNRTIAGRLPLSALDCLNISQVALNESFYDRAVEWAEQAITKAANEEPPTVPKEELDAHLEAAIKQHDEVLSTKGATGYLWQTYGVPVENRTHRSTEFKTELFKEQLPHDQEMQNYKRLCRGEVLRLETSLTYDVPGVESPAVRTSSK
ncbi:prolyl 4-hydroxylase subunit alpha-2-like [Ixodes scapularis]|uniref:prolyl 4-hydroxylase subunit alpha-2-like n=1 Tax=Ixodes scapularis TaxID=6945 RepID=UPI001A9D60A1|nr:prolyl 4-hydroxylase subunit alpha-2-like [Ixodes scapularis]